MVLCDPFGLVRTSPGEQDLDEGAERVPLDGRTGTDPFGEPQPGPYEVLRLRQTSAPEADVGQEGVREREVRTAPALAFELRGAGREQLLGAARAIGVEEREGDQDGDFEPTVLGGPAQSAVEGAFGMTQGDGGGFGAQHGVPAAQADDVALGEVASGEPVSEAGQPPGAGGRVGLVGAEGVPHEFLGPHTQPGARVGGEAGFAGQGVAGLAEAVAVGEDLGEAVDDALAQGGVGDGLLEGRAQMVDGGSGFGEQGGAAEFVQDGGPVLEGRGSRRARARCRHAASGAPARRVSRAASRRWWTTQGSPSGWVSMRWRAAAVEPSPASTTDQAAWPCRATRTASGMAR